MQKKKFDYVLLIMVLCIFFSGLVIGNISKDVPLVSGTQIMKTTGTSSMLPAMQPDVELETKEFEGKPKCGHVYIYSHNSSLNIVHRFLYESNDGKYYFRGDNNPYYDEPINLSQIKYEVVSLRI